MAEIAVSVQNLTKDFPRVRALDNVSFDVPRGALYGLLGPNGAGKTTLFSIAANFLFPSAGEIEVLGVNVRQISQLRGRYSMLPQDALFQANVPVIEQMITFCQLHGQNRKEAEEAADKALALVGLTDARKRAARTLSHGMTKRMALAQAFLGDPEVVFLDEPTSGLDPQNAANVRQLIRQMAGSRTVLISSHNLHEIQELCSHCAILDVGHLVSAGTMKELLGSDYLVRISFSKPHTPALLTALRGLANVREVDTPGPDQLELTLEVARSDGAKGQERDAVMRSVLQTLLTMDFVPRSLNPGAHLEQKFLEMTGGEGDDLGST
jgi:ABC-2 type transport system ATP-binding protein